MINRLEIESMDKRAGFVVLATALMLTNALGGCSKSPVIDTPATSAPTATNNVVNIDVINHVKTALLQDAVLKDFEINVITLKGDVRLIGMLATQAQIDAAITIARAAEGVHSIHNELTLKS
ncbi:MAG: BON domain-containing protein [Burkholderiales bacterium]